MHVKSTSIKMAALGTSVFALTTAGLVYAQSIAATNAAPPPPPPTMDTRPPAAS